jgi:hypothetical protein
MANVLGQLTQVLMRLSAGKGFIIDRSDEGAVAGVLEVLQGVFLSLSMGKMGEAAKDSQEDEYATHARKYVKGQALLKRYCTFASHSFHHAPQPFRNYRIAAGSPQHQSRALLVTQGA